MDMIMHDIQSSFLEVIEMSEPISDPPIVSDDLPSPRRPFFRLRFGLKSFLAFVTLAGLCFGFIYPCVQRAKTESEAISQLKSLYPQDKYSQPQILYDYQVAEATDWRKSFHVAEDAAAVSKLEPSTPKWVQAILGEHCFSTVKRVRLIGAMDGDPESFDSIVPHIAKFKNLEEIDVSNLGCRKDADFFASWPNLRVLGLGWWMELEDLTGLANLNKLESLDLSVTNIRSIAPVADCSRMKELTLLECRSLEDIELIADMSELTMLEQSYCSKVKSLDYLDRFENLEVLGCSASDHVKSFDFALIAKNKNLKSLSLSGFDSFENIELLSEFSNLNDLRLDYCHGFERLPSLKNLTKLRSVQFDNCNALKSLQGIGDSGALDALAVYGCKSLKKVESVSGLNGVTALRVGNCDQIANYQFVSTMKALSQIYLEGASVRNLDMLKGLELSLIDIRNCPNLVDISGLSDVVVGHVTLENCVKVTKEMTLDIEDETEFFINVY